MCFYYLLNRNTELAEAFDEQDILHFDNQRKQVADFFFSSWNFLKEIEKHFFHVSMEL